MRKILPILSLSVILATTGVQVFYPKKREEHMSPFEQRIAQYAPQNEGERIKWKEGVKRIDLLSLKSDERSYLQQVYDARTKHWVLNDEERNLLKIYGFSPTNPTPQEVIALYRVIHAVASVSGTQ